MARALFDTTTLNSVVASNHSCALLFTASVNPRMSYVNRWRGEKEAKILYKIHSALEQKDKDRRRIVKLSYLENVPLNCIHMVLELVQKCPVFIQHDGEATLQKSKIEIRIQHISEGGDLNRLFQVMKGWNMPVLFSYGGSDCKTPTKKGGDRKRKRN